MNYLALILSFFISLIGASLLINPLTELLSEKGFNLPNFRNDVVPVGNGLMLLLVPAATASLLSLFFPYIFASFLPFLGFFAGISLLGMLDDFLGDRSTGGFKGHFSAVLRGKVTSGFIKAVGSLAFTLLLLRYLSIGSVILFIVDLFLILLFINTVNLLDLAPGRALKFSFVSLALLLPTLNPFYFITISLFLAPTIVLFLPDIRGDSMMGDVGSNLLGAVIGLTAVITLTPTIKMIILLVIVLINLYAEFGSVSQLISRSKVLKSIDELGRRF